MGNSSNTGKTEQEVWRPFLGEFKKGIQRRGFKRSKPNPMYISKQRTHPHRYSFWGQGRRIRFSYYDVVAQWSLSKVPNTVFFPIHFLHKTSCHNLDFLQKNVCKILILSPPFSFPSSFLPPSFSSASLLFIKLMLSFCFLHRKYENWFGQW